MSKDYQPPKVWKHENKSGGEFANINRPTAGAQCIRDLPEGEHPFQLYSMGTPNGVKVTILFEELLALGIQEVEYDAFCINILEGDQFTSGFVDINPNSKIPALVDRNNGNPVRVFESGSILLYLARKFDQFLPSEDIAQTEVLNWLFWQMGSAPYLGGGFGHFYKYAPEKIEYAINRFTMETKRQLDVLDQQLSKHEFIAGKNYSIADMAIFPWYGTLVKNKMYEAAEFVSAHEYKHIIRWADSLMKRTPVIKGSLVNKFWGDEDQQLNERHSDADFDRLRLEL
jgi:GST-like protein